MPQGMRFVIPVALCLSVSAEVSLFKGMKRDELLGIRTADFMRDEFRYLNVSRVGTAIVSGPLDCGHACLENAACFSFNVGASGAFDSGKLQCELLATHKYNASEQLKENQMFHHYSIYTHCFRNPCQNGGKCINVYKDEAEDHCDCPEGYSGKHCEQDIDECASAGRCHSSAVCVNTPGSYSCTCKAPFSLGANGTCTIEDSGCQSHTNLTDADRNSTFNGGDKICDRDVITPGWFRFQGPAGTRMPTSCVPIQHCNTHAPGWLDGEHPSANEGPVLRRVCFHWSSSCCNWNNDIVVRNCSNFFVYYLVPPSACRLRYCGTE